MKYKIEFADSRRKSFVMEARNRKDAIRSAFVKFGAGFVVKKVTN